MHNHPPVSGRVPFAQFVGDLLRAPPSAQQLRRTVTWDQGKELAGHLQITADTGARVYFCDAHSPWQRGTHENTNGLLRDYFPKGMDLRGVTPEQLAAVAEELNDRPRKTLDWARPSVLFARHLDGRAAVTTLGSQPQKMAVGSLSISSISASICSVGGTRS